MSNYPPGVTGNEFEIAGPDWEDDMLVRCCDCGWAGMATVWAYRGETYWECPECGEEHASGE